MRFHRCHNRKKCSAHHPFEFRTNSTGNLVRCPHAESIRVYGNRILHLLPKSCQDQWMIGHTLNGFYSIKGVKMMESVFCDLTALLLPWHRVCICTTTKITTYFSRVSCWRRKLSHHFEKLFYFQTNKNNLTIFVILPILSTLLHFTIL